LGQGITPSTSPNGFRPFICGSNTYGKLPLTIALIPQVLNENLRCLKMAKRPYETKQYSNSDNLILHMPVWGTFGGFEPVEYDIEVAGLIYSVFQPEVTDPNVPSVFDGTSGGSVMDFNGSGIIAVIASNWNSIQRLITNQYMSLTSMGGDARNGPFLQYTRYCSFNQPTIDVTGMRLIPKRWKKYIKEVVDEEIITGGTLVKKNSKTSVKSKKLIYAPSGSTILNEFTIAYSALIPISPTMKENFPNLIIPVVEVLSGLPSINQVQTSTLESYNLILPGAGQLVNSRSEEIEASLSNYIKGQAGDDSELSKYITSISERNDGGFFGDLFSAIGPSVINGAVSVLTSM